MLCTKFLVHVENAFTVCPVFEIKSNFFFSQKHLKVYYRCSRATESDRTTGSDMFSWFGLQLGVWVFNCGSISDKQIVKITFVGVRSKSDIFFSF